MVVRMVGMIRLRPCASVVKNASSTIHPAENVLGCTSMSSRRSQASGNRAGKPCSIFFVFWMLFLPVIGSAQGEQSRSIHAIESEAHRFLQPAPVWGPGTARPLSPSAPSNLTHTIFGFYPYWAPGFSQVRFEDLTHLAYFSLETDETGRVVNSRGWPNVPLISAAHQASVRVVLVCTLFDSSRLAALLSSSAARQTLIGNLREQVLLGGADGVNIDFEGMPVDQRGNLVTFMRDLSATLKAAIPGAHISIDTPAVDWSGAWDYAALAEACDALMIMAYDYHWSGSKNPGPVSPLWPSVVWGKYCVVSSIADYLAKIGAGQSSKLILGVPYYGYDWPAQNDVLNTGAVGTAVSRTYAASATGAVQYGWRWDENSSTPWYFYSSSVPHQTWFEDAASLAQKYELVRQNALQGIGIWALTYDAGHMELWQQIENHFLPPEGPSPPELTVPAVFFDTFGLPVAVKERGETPAVRFEVAVGITSGGTEISDFKSIGWRHQALIRDLQLADGRTYHVMARSVGQDGIAGSPCAPVPIRIDSSLQVTRKYLPRWVSSSDFYTGLAAVNSSSAVRAIRIRGHVSGASGVIETSWVLKSGEQLAQILSQPDLLGADISGGEGWLELRFESEGLQSMYLIGDTGVSRALDGGPLVDAHLVQTLPAVDGGRASISMVNPGETVAHPQVSLSLADGSVQTRTVKLDPAQMLTATAADLFPQAGLIDKASPDLPARSPFLSVSSDTPVLCTSMVQRTQDNAVIPALDPGAALKNGAFPYASLGCLYRNQIMLLNPSQQAQKATLRLLGVAQAAPVTVEVPPLAVVSAEAGALFGITGSGSSGSCIASGITVSVTEGSGVVGSLLLHSENMEITTASPLDTPAAQVFSFPQLAQAQGYWTGLSITNSGAAAVNVTVEALDAAGVSLGVRELQGMQPGETRVSLIYQWIPATAGLSSGRIEVRATGPVLATEIFGSDTLSFMAAVPGK